MKSRLKNRNTDFVLKGFTAELLNSAGVYKILFDNGYFYIGSTKNLKTRYSCWKTRFNNGKNLHNKKMYLGFNEAVLIEYIFIKKENDHETAKKSEAEILLLHKNNPLLINRSMDTNSNSGVTWTKEENEKRKMRLKYRFKIGELVAGKHNRGRKSIK